MKIVFHIFCSVHLIGQRVVLFLFPYTHYVFETAPKNKIEVDEVELVLPVSAATTNVVKDVVKDVVKELTDRQ